jgi:2-aminoadipate transaminase
MNIEGKLASRTKNIRASAIRKLFKIAQKPGMISLGGGYPAPESFPVQMIEELTSRVLKKYGTYSMQYDLTEGFIPLRKALAEFLKTRMIQTSEEAVLITSGSQGLLDSMGKIFISKGDPIAVEAPTYLGALQAFNAYEPTYIRMDTDDDGVLPESVEAVLKAHDLKFIYLVPTFQNPTGRTIPLERREEIARIVKSHDALVIEDDPYSDLRYRGEPVPPIQTLAPENVVYASTLSKILAPGFRIGFCVAPESVKKWLVLTKQGVDLHASTFTQALAAEYVAEGFLAKQLPSIISIYKPKQEAMLQSLDDYFPDNFKWSKPEGGMFIWVEGPPGTDMLDVYEKALERNVAYVPGRYFYSQEGEGRETMRLNFTNTKIETIEPAIKNLSEVIAEVV